MVASSVGRTIASAVARAVAGIASGGGSGGPVTPADIVVTNNTEWNALDSTDISGMIIELDGTFTRLAVTNLDPVSRATIRTASGTQVPGFDFSGTCDNLTFACDMQETEWPRANTSIVYWGTGTFGATDGIYFSGCTFRHGYGASHLDFDMTATYDEYARIDNVRTATTTSATYAIPWDDPAMTEGFIEFFNRGANTVYFEVGGSGITTTTTATYSAAPGQRTRTATIDPTSVTHIAIITATGSSEVNARAEIGLSSYLTSAFSASGAANTGKIHVKGCTFRDLRGAAKGFGVPSELVIIDNDFDRIYEDIVSISPATSGAAYVMRNLWSVPFSRSGIAENLTGDARDPHGDLFQMFGTGGAAIGPIYSAGNRCRRSARRLDVLHQGIFWTDNDFDPSFSSVYSISDTLIGGNTNQLAIGEGLYPAGDVFVWGATVVDTLDLASGVAAIRIDTDGNHHVVVDHSVYQNALAESSPFVVKNSLRLDEAATPASVFPNIASLPTASSRAQIESALATAAEGTGYGAAATANAIDWTTTDHTAIILWQNVGAGVGWTDLTSQDIDTVITLPLSKVQNRRASQTVVPGSGVEWRSVDTDGTTEVQAWTTSSGTIEPDQYIQIRKTSSASGLTTVDFDVTINGFLVSTSVKTKAETPAVFHTQSGTGPYFRDPANATPASTTRFEVEINFYPTGNPGANVLLFSQESTGCDLTVLTTGGLRVNIEDGGGASVVLNQNASQGITLNEWQALVLDVDQVAGTASLTKNGVLIGSWTWTPGANAFFQTVREIAFFGSTGGTSLLPVNWQIEYGRAYFTTSGVRSLRKEVSGNAATVNADAWKLGGDAT